MKEKPKKKRITRVPLEMLKPHPFQAKLGPPSPEKKIKQLADDIRDNGQLTPIEYVGDHEIICGCDRLLALAMLGEEYARCWHREDLEDEGEEAIRRRMVEDNLNRKQLSKLAQARYALALFEIEAGRSVDELWTLDQQRARDRVGKVVGISGRHLNRYFRILKTPMAVQTAFDNGELPLVDADKVAGLPQEIQDEIAAKITALTDGKKAKKVVSNYLGAAAKTKNRHSVVSAFIRAIKRANKALEEHSLAGYTARPLEGEMEALQQCREYIDRILVAYEEGEQQYCEAMEKLST